MRWWSPGKFFPFWGGSRSPLKMPIGAHGARSTGAAPTASLLLRWWCGRRRLRAHLWIRAGEFGGSLFHQAPHESLIGGNYHMPPMTDQKTVDLAGIDPGVNLSRADAALLGELADWLGIGIVHSTALNSGGQSDYISHSALRCDNNLLQQIAICWSVLSPSCSPVGAATRQSHQ